MSDIDTRFPLPDLNEPKRHCLPTMPPIARTAPPVAHATLAAEQVARALVGRTVAHVERDLILETLKHCRGNRTHAANILGISIRTLRNKLNEYAEGGVGIPPPGTGESARMPTAM